LRGDPQTIASRIAGRQHRYMPPALLASQLATLEPPRDAIDVDVGIDLATQVATIVDALGLRRASEDGPAAPRIA